MSLFSTLNTGVSGLSASQVGIATTGHNISNVHSEHYTRQRVVQTADIALHDIPGGIGLGVQIDAIARIHDEFVFARLRQSENSTNYTGYMRQHLEEISKRFPDLKDAGIQLDLANYFKAWNDYAAHPEEGSQKINLVQKAKTLTQSIKNTKDSLRTIQESINKQIKTNIEEANRLGQEIANINAEIGRVESTNLIRANDLRDKRDELELTLSKILDISVFKRGIETENIYDKNLTDKGTGYHLNIDGFSFVSGAHFHPIIIDNNTNKSVFYTLYYEKQDGKLMKMDEHISGGKVGAMLDLRGRSIGTKDGEGIPTDGIITEYMNNLDALAQTISVQTNNIYAKSAQEKMISNELKDLSRETTLLNYNDSIQRGDFDIVVYDTDGTELARKTISINPTTVIDDTSTPPKTNTLIYKINSDTDDNKDNNTLNDVDDYYKAVYMYDVNTNTGNLQLVPKDISRKYRVAIEDKGTNIPGVFGMSRFFTGLNADDFSVDGEILSDPSIIQAHSAPADGNNEVANDMVQMQYDDLRFYRKDKIVFSYTVEGFYRFGTTKIANDTEANNYQDETNKAVLNSVSTEHQSISGVNMDEELINLMKFQTAYGANAKTITTIDQMLQTLLGIKQ